MKLTSSTVVATFTALLIGGLSISPTLAAVNQAGRGHTRSHAVFEVNGDSSYMKVRGAPDLKRASRCAAGCAVGSPARRRFRTGGRV